MPVLGQGQQEGKTRNSEHKTGLPRLRVSNVTLGLPTQSGAEHTLLSPLLLIHLLCCLPVARNLLFFLALLDSLQIYLSVTLIITKKITVSIKKNKTPA